MFFQKNRKDAFLPHQIRASRLEHLVSVDCDLKKHKEAVHSSDQDALDLLFFVLKDLV